MSSSITLRYASRDSISSCSTSGLSHRTPTSSYVARRRSTSSCLSCGPDEEFVTNGGLPSQLKKADLTRWSSRSNNSPSSHSTSTAALHLVRTRGVSNIQSTQSAVRRSAGAVSGSGTESSSAPDCIRVGPSDIIRSTSRFKRLFDAVWLKRSPRQDIQQHQKYIRQSELISF